jgi:hypothetical protein
MITKKGSKDLSPGIYFALLTGCIIVGPAVSVFATRTAEKRVETSSFSTFRKALEDQDDARALSTGNIVYPHLNQKYKDDAGFVAFKSKLDAAGFLAGQMQQQLKKATNAQMFSVADELFDKKDGQAESRRLSIAPAKSFYETSVKLFTRPIRIDNLTGEEKSFLVQYYNLKLRDFTCKIAKAGQALAIAEPSFKGTHDYVLVLPLLHVSGKRPVSIDVLPQWMRKPAELDTFADSCLLHFGLPFHAMTFARKAAESRNSPFSESDYYRLAARKCGTSRAHIAVDCLQRAIDCVKAEAPDEAIALQFETVQLWLDSSNYSLAAGEAHKIFEGSPNHKESGKAIWLYYYSLSRGNNISQILTGIDEALNDRRCSPYKAKLMYIKWWALRRTRDQIARVAALEHELLKLYGDDPMVAPVLLSRATDSLASQDYAGALGSLTTLVQKFPSTKAAIQAKKMLAKLKGMKAIE